MFKHHKYLDLNMGLVKENFVLVNRKDVPLWESRGFEKVSKYPIFGYRLKSDEVVMLSKPLYVEQFGLDNIKGSKIIDVKLLFGTYGMGGAGFVGFKLEGNFGVRWLVYCIWESGESILVDDRIIECHPKYNNMYNPYVNMDDWQNSYENFKKFIYGWCITNILLTDNTLEISAVDENSLKHTIYTAQFCEKFPEMGGTGKKRKSFEDGKMSDYWLIIYDGTELAV